MPKESRYKPLLVKEIPVPKANRHPPIPHDVLPAHEATIAIIAPKGSGKTTLLMNLLMMYKGYFETILVFSPSVENDDKWDWIKQQDLLCENKRLVKAMKEIEERGKKKFSKNPVVDVPSQGWEDKTGAPYVEKRSGKFNAKIPEGCFMADYTESDLLTIVKEQDSIIRYIKKHGYSKHVANRILMICDDMVGSDLFNNSKKNPFKMLNANHRHKSMTLWMISQAYTEIPKTVRTNYTALIIFEIFSDAEIKTIMEEYPMGMRKRQWYEAYVYCVGDDFGFMYYDVMKPKRLRVMKNFDQVVYFKDENPSVDELISDTKNLTL